MRLFGTLRGRWGWGSACVATLAGHFLDAYLTLSVFHTLRDTIRKDKQNREQYPFC